MASAASYAQGGAFRPGAVLVTGDRYLLFDRDTYYKNYRVEVYRHDGVRLFQGQVFTSAESQNDRSDPPHLLGVFERSNSVLYAAAGSLYAYNYSTNQETRLARPDSQHLSSSDAFIADPAAGVVFRKLSKAEGTGPFSFELDVATNTVVPLPLPSSATPVRKQADGSYLAFENSSTWKDDALVSSRFTISQFRAGERPRVLLKGSGNVSGRIGDDLVIEDPKRGTSLYALDAGKLVTFPGQHGQFIARNAKESCFLDEKSYVLTCLKAAGKSAAASIQMPRVYYARWMFAKHPVSGDLLFFDSTTRQFTVPGRGDAQTWPVVSLQSDGKPAESKYDCRFAAVLRESLDVRGGPVSGTDKGTYSWSHHAPSSIDFINTAWEDIDEDGARDLLIQYVHWKPELEAVDIVFGDGKGGFAGHQRVKCAGKLYTAPGLMRLHSAETTDDQPWIGCHVRHNKTTNQLDVYDVKDLAARGSTYQPANNCEQAVEKNGYAYHFLAQSKRAGQPWSLIQDNQPLTRVVEFRKRYDNTDYNRDGKTDDVLVSDGNSRRLPGAAAPTEKTVTFLLTTPAGERAKSVHSLPGDVQAAQVGDFNGDNFPDLAIAFKQDRRQLMIVYGGAAPADFERRLYGVQATLDTMLPVDLDGDGRAELTSRHGGDLDIISFDAAKAVAREQRLQDIRFSEFNYAAFDRINSDGTLDYAAISLFDARKGEVSVTPYIGEFSGDRYVLHGARQKWMDFQGQVDAYLKEYNAWKAAQQASQTASRKVCSVCSGSGMNVRAATTECRMCGSCSGQGRFTSGGYGGSSSRYETWNGREVMVTRFYNSYSSTTCSTCGGTGEVCYHGYAPCEHCGGSGREP